ncbi:MAG TPA: OmpA family protein [Egibacteraceae bacterium]|nr:OmpA family protein [Egibacteraceae bacterium]
MTGAARLLAAALALTLGGADAVHAAADAADQGRQGAGHDEVTGALDEFIVSLAEGIVALDLPVVPLVRSIAPLAGDQNALIAEEGGDTVKFDLAADVFFDFDRHDLRPEASEFLETVAARIAQDSPPAVRIEGHTDSVGDPGFNQGLSERRAEAVRAYLVDAGLDDVAFAVEGFGETRPIAPNEAEDADGNLVDNPDGRQRNRRVEITYADPDSAG